MYRCGSTFSQTPCGDGAREVRNAGVGQPVVPPPLEPIDAAREATLATMCMAAIRSVPAWKDRDSLKIERPQRGAAGVAREVNGRRMAVVPWYGHVNGKNSYGGYVGDKIANCYFDSSESRLVDIYVQQ